MGLCGGEGGSSGEVSSDGASEGATTTLEPHYGALKIDMVCFQGRLAGCGCVGIRGPGWWAFVHRACVTRCVRTAYRRWPTRSRSANHNAEVIFFLVIIAHLKRGRISPTLSRRFTDAVMFLPINTPRAPRAPRRTPKPPPLPGRCPGFRAPHQRRRKRMRFRRKMRRVKTAIFRRRL